MSTLVNNITKPDRQIFFQLIEHPEIFAFIDLNALLSENVPSKYEWHNQDVLQHLRRQGTALPELDALANQNVVFLGVDVDDSIACLVILFFDGQSLPEKARIYRFYRGRLLPVAVYDPSEAA